MSKSLPKTHPCRKAACRIQLCLQENIYQQEKCEEVIQKMIKCCHEMNVMDSVQCSGFVNVKTTTPSVDKE